jgi:hypothetical protein
MIKELLLLSIIYSISIIYNDNIRPILIYYLTSEYYNNLIISLLILIQIDNFTLFYDLTKKTELETSHTKIEDKYLKIILNQISYINKKEQDFNRRIVRFKENHKKINRSHNDIFNLC